MKSMSSRVGRGKKMAPPSLEGAHKASSEQYADSVDYFQTLLKSFEKAGTNSGIIEQYYKIADKIIKLRFAGPRLLPFITPALEHLAIQEAGDADFTVCLWDGLSTSAPLPFPPWCQNDSPSKDEQKRYSDERITIIIDVGPSRTCFNILDKKQNLALMWVDDAQKIPYYDVGAPLRDLLYSWMRIQNVQFVHAGAVGIEDRGVLLVGKGGSGKSTTALACLLAGLKYASDDYVLIENDPPRISSIYNTVKLRPDNVSRFPILAETFKRPVFPNADKVVLFLHDQFPEKLCKGFAIHAILIPRITLQVETRLRKASAVESLVALAPSTILQLAGESDGQRDMKQLAALVKQVPSYYLELGSDVSEIPKVILKLLKDG